MFQGQNLIDVQDFHKLAQEELPVGSLNDQWHRWWFVFALWLTFPKVFKPVWLKAWFYDHVTMTNYCISHLKAPLEATTPSIAGFITLNSHRVRMVFVLEVRALVGPIDFCLVPPFVLRSKCFWWRSFGGASRGQEWIPQRILRSTSASVFMGILPCWCSQLSLVSPEGPRHPRKRNLYEFVASRG